MTDGIRSQGLMKSKFPVRTTVTTNDKFDFVSGDGTNTLALVTRCLQPRIPNLHLGTS